MLILQHSLALLTLLMVKPYYTNLVSIRS
jgi:hypothetical protein